MNYQEAVEYLFTQLPIFQRQGQKAYKANLNNTLALDTYLQHPHRSFKTIHVAGTNGKGSVSHMLASVLQEAGFTVGLYTSPHLKDFRERIKINGTMLEEAFVTDFVMLHKAYFETLQPSFFEMTVAMAFQYFSHKNVDIAVIEVGLGGRLDSTNIISPLVSVITNISLDHTDLLGTTIEEITHEKAGIIKKQTPVIIGEYTPVTRTIFEEKARLLQSDIFFTNTDNKALPEADLKGIYQEKNIATVLQTISILQEQLDISNNAIQKGIANTIKNTGLQGRWQLLSENPKIICDTGHNAAAFTYITKQLKDEIYNRLHIVWGMVKDKDVASILEWLPKNAQYYISQPDIERAMSADDLLQYFKNKGFDAGKYPSIKDALKNAKKNATHNDLIFIGGSTFTVAEVI